MRLAGSSVATAAVASLLLGLGTTLRLTVVVAYPDGSACCDSGSGIGGSHLNAPDGNGGDITNGNYRLLLNGTELLPADGDDDGNATAPYPVCAGGVGVPVVLDGGGTGGDDDAYFLGFMIRIAASGGGGEADGVEGDDDDDRVPTLAVTDVSRAQVMENDVGAVCPSDWGSAASCPPGVSAVTHVNDGAKTEVAATLALPPVAAGILVGTRYDLEVTVVRENRDRDNDKYFYSKFLVEAVDCGGGGNGSTGGSGREEEEGCAADVQECPDGSYLSRDPANGCEFTPCPESEEEEAIFCAADVQECPDGSDVSRDPANGCEFAPCPESEGPGIACTDDVGECPDGTFVPRDPNNNCAFALCALEGPVGTDAASDVNASGSEQSTLGQSTNSSGGYSIRKWHAGGLIGALVASATIACSVASS